MCIKVDIENRYPNNSVITDDRNLNAGIFKSCFDDHRTYMAAGVGFRSSYYKK